MDPKIIILFVLIGAIIGLSYLSEKNLGRMRRRLFDRRWRAVVPMRRRT